MKKWLIASLLLVFVLVLGACSQATTEDKEEVTKETSETEGQTQNTSSSTEEKLPKVAFVYIGVPSDEK